MSVVAVLWCVYSCGMRESYGRLYSLNQQLISGYQMRSNNHHKLLDCLKQVNQVIQRAAQLRCKHCLSILTLHYCTSELFTVACSDGQIQIAIGILITIWTIKIWLKRSWFDLRFDSKFLVIWFEKSKSQQISCLLTDAKQNAWIIETLLLWMRFNAETTPHWLNDWHLSTGVLWLYEV